jgi:predicted ATPase
MKYFIKQLHEEYSNGGLLLPPTVRILECNLKVLYKGSTFKIELGKEDLNFFSVHFNYMLDTLFDGEQDKWIKEIYHKADSYDTPLLLEPYKNNDKRQVIDLDIIEYLNNQNLLRFYHELSSNTKITNFFNPNRLSISIAQRGFDWLNLSDEDFECLGDCRYFIAYKFFQLYDNNNTFLDLREDSKIKICKICTKIKSLYENKDYNKLSYLYIALKVLTSNRELFNQKEYEKISSWADTLNSEKNLLEFITKLDLKNLIDNDAPEYEVMKIKVTINFLENKTYINEKFVDNIDKIVSLEEVQNILEFIPPWINVEWYEDNKSIKSLSSGEKSFFTFLINLMYQVQNINNEPKYNTINLFLDETELGFHPQWHKEYLNNILEALKKINEKKINIIFATHSPFLISDLPKENVMFLKDGKQVKGTEKKQTFGANIHTLLSDSFFMEDGLMGEFAKNKIEEVIDYLNDKKSPIKDNNKAQKLIDIIGEPIIRNQLQKMLDSKRLTKMDEIDIIKVEIADLEKRLEDIEDANNKA